MASDSGRVRVSNSAAPGGFGQVGSERQVSVLAPCRTQSDLRFLCFSFNQYNVTPALFTQTSPKAKFSKSSHTNLQVHTEHPLYSERPISVTVKEMTHIHTHTYFWQIPLHCLKHTGFFKGTSQ